MPSLDRVTPVILTYNEKPNIGRTLERLRWAQRVVVVDSGSDDGTCGIVRSFTNTALFQRDFDTPARQWNHGLEQVDTEWTLALDADYQVPEAAIREIASIPDHTEANGYYAEFGYAVLGHRLPKSLYPARQVLFRTDSAVFENDGHTQRVQVEGRSERLHHRLVHDDRKPLGRWLRNQAVYADLEAEKLTSVSWSDLSLADRLRRTRILGPPAVFVYCLLGKGLLLEGRPGWYYTLERTVAEAVLVLALLRDDDASHEDDGNVDA